MVAIPSAPRRIRPVHYAVALVRDLTVPIEPIAPAASCRELLKRFHREPNLWAIPVQEQGGRWLTVLLRRRVLDLFSRAYVRDIFLRRTVADLLRRRPELADLPVQAQATERLDQFALTLLAKDPQLNLDAVPVLDGKRPIGILHVADLLLGLHDAQGRFSEHMETTVAHLRAEVAQAALFQRRILPPPHIELPGVRGMAVLITSTEVGGDYYDYYSIDGRWAVILVGDVSGHGVASGTMVSAAKAAVELLSAHRQCDPGAILTQLNHALLSVGHGNFLMTMFTATLDVHSGTLHYANAGHQFPYLYRTLRGQLDCLELGGLPLGKSCNGGYVTQATGLAPGDRLIVYTDGVVEEENAAGEPFGYERLEDTLRAHATADPEKLIDATLGTLITHLGRRGFADDVTLLAIDYHGRPAPAQSC